jgi:4-hydroxy-tetrahydrodipicolinate synthase
VIYNVPSRTCCDIEAHTLAELAKHPMVVGVKEATADMARAARIRELCGPDFDLLSGDDFTILPFLAVGGHGVISVGSNCAPALFAQLCDAAKAGRWDEARDLHYRQLPLSRALFCTTSPIPIKAAMAMMGKMAPEIRLPLEPLPEDSPEHRELAQQLRNLELLS